MNLIKKGLEYFSGLRFDSKHAPDYKPAVLDALKENPDLDLDCDQEVIKKYFENQDPEYLKDLESLIAQKSAMNPNNRLSVAIPAYQEGANGNLEKTLECYGKMKEAGGFEIVVFENHSSDVGRDDTSQVISKIQTRFPELNIVHFYKSFSDKTPIGNVRKYLNDLILLRKMQFGREENILMVSNDADAEMVGPEYLKQIIEYFENNPGVDVARGNTELPKEVYKEYPIIYAAKLLQKELHHSLKEYRPDLAVRAGGANSVFRSGIYAAIGGYDQTRIKGEDIDLSKRAWKARGRDFSRIGHFDGTIVTNPRRILDAINQNRGIAFKASNFSDNDSAHNIDKKSLELDGQITESSFEREAQLYYEKFKDDVPLGKRSEWFEGVLSRIGVEGSVVGDQIVIKKVDALKEGLPVFLENLKQNNFIDEK